MDLHSCGAKKSDITETSLQALALEAEAVTTPLGDTQPSRRFRAVTRAPGVRSFIFPYRIKGEEGGRRSPFPDRGGRWLMGGDPMLELTF